MADNPNENQIRLPRHPSLLDAARSALLVVDIQSVLLPYIWEKEKLVLNTGYMLEIAQIHKLPVVVTEHYSKGLGVTDPRLVQALKDTGFGYNPIEKNIFSCCGHEHILEVLKKTGRRQIIVVGMETHICINQTVLDLLFNGFEPHVVEDAVRARWRNSHKIGIKKIREAGAIICDWEMAAYELTYGAKTAEFKSLLALMKKAGSESRDPDEQA
jgi:nicotinamidase-related amidase